MKNEIGGDGITTGEQLDGFCKKYFSPSVYRGIAINGNVPALKNNQFVIHNRDEHWSSVFKKNNKTYDWDSYSRDLFPEYIDSKVPIKERQNYGGADLQDCGYRVIAKMIMEMPNSFEKSK